MDEWCRTQTLRIKRATHTDTHECFARHACTGTLSALISTSNSQVSSEASARAYIGRGLAEVQVLGPLGVAAEGLEGVGLVQGQEAKLPVAVWPLSLLIAPLLLPGLPACVPAGMHIALHGSDISVG